ncbi:hypothetical protein CERSUDRAFT_63676 [Gelatoporia subvermispora B]|uniref:Uncharacterized protein n=1 Tax=Ceriporiopsis subvermispora (strain B) TaxID=914234 RepID=M2RMX6_CERS8|nr:hypothetical protein CERSUDRAFT_63676 [Gelatoporia subvermispora B]
MNPDELDQRIRCLPLAFGIRYFKNSISGLAQISGSERKDMARILLACLIGKVPKAFLIAFRSILDFIYLAQYPTHDDTTLGYLEQALDCFHQHKSVIMNLGVRDHLNIPKFHSLLHYVQSIRFYGATDNYNTEMFERLHIDFAKEGWRASNHRNERPQMVRWLSRREKIVHLESYLKTTKQTVDQDILKNRQGHAIKIAKFPQSPKQTLSAVEKTHCAPGFTHSLKTFLNLLNSRSLSRAELNNAILPFNHIDLYHNFKLTPTALHDDITKHEVIKAKPAIKGQPAQFDTVVVFNSHDAESTGVAGTRIGRLRAIFTLPSTIHEGIRPAPPTWPKGPLAYIEWYSPLKSTANSDSLMYTVSNMPLRPDGIPIGQVIPLTYIRQSCQLIPHFGTSSPREI